MDVMIERVENLISIKRKVNLTRFEKVTIIVLLTMVLSLMTASIYTRAVVSETNARVETIKEETAKLSVDSQVLQQKIDDLMTYERIVSVATKYGLTQNINNVKAVDK